MKKFKKLLAGLLGTAMVMSSLTMTAFADNGDGVPAASQAITDSTIDYSKTGNLTIHKFEYNGDTPGQVGTGSATDIVPNGAQGLNGVTFTVYKMLDADEMKAYYAQNPTALPEVSDYLVEDANGDYEKNADGTYKFTVGTSVAAEDTHTVVTSTQSGVEGIAKLENLPLGIYLVTETASPDKVTGPVAPFLVSIPMTTVAGDDWLYDVEVFPKNETTYGEIALQKSGVESEKLNGITFKLEKETSPNNWDEVTVNDETRQAYPDGTFTTATFAAGNESGLVGDGYIYVTGLSQGHYRFTESSINRNIAGNEGYILDTVKTYEFWVTDEGKTYLAGETEADAKELNTIAATNEKPDLKKEVKANGGENYGSSAQYMVGDKVPYKITVDVPKNITDLKTFNVTDVPTNLKDDVSGLKVYYTDDNNVKTELAKTDTASVTIEHYEVNEQGNGFILKFSTENIGAVAGKQLTIEYEAELLSSAVLAGNKNDATLTYSNETGTNTTSEGKITDEAIVYTFQLDLTKYKDENKAGNELSGVEFELYQYNGTKTSDVTEADLTGNDGTKISVVEQTAGVSGYYLVADSTKTSSKTTLTTDGNGKVKVTGLENGNYYLVETKTEEGYNLLSAPVKVEISVSTSTAWTIEKAWTEADDVYTFTKKGGTITTTYNVDSTGTNGVVSTSVVNKKGFTLPTTGGMGTMMFTIIGAILMLGGAFVLFRSSKKKTA